MRGAWLEQVGRWVAVQGPVPEPVLERQDDLVLNAAQGRSAVHVSVAQGGVLDGAQQVSHSAYRQRLKAGRARLAGGLGVPAAGSTPARARAGQTILARKQ